MNSSPVTPSESKFLLIFFALALGIGAMGYSPWVLDSYGLFPYSSVVIPLFFIGGLSPAIAAVITTKLQYGNVGIKELFRQFVRKDFHKGWFLIPFLLTFGNVFISLGLLSASTGVNYFDLSLLALFIPILIFMFLQNMWEEIGWRGYALPTLQTKYHALLSGAIVAVFVTAWHWPHFAVKDSVMRVNYHNFLWFFLSVLISSIIVTWLYNSTNGSLTVSTLNHSSFNALGALYFMDQGVAPVILPYWMLFDIVIAAVILAVFKPETLSHRPKATFKMTKI